MHLRARVHLRLAKIALGIALSLLAASLILWVGSYWRGHWLIRTSWSLSATTDEWWKTQVLCGSGVVNVIHAHEMEPAFVGNFVSTDAPFRNDRTIPTGVKWDSMVLPLPFGSRPTEMRFGIFWHAGRGRWNAQIALWLPTLVSLIATIPFLLLVRRAYRPWRRMRAGLCPACGYDIRATPAKCPECGTAIPATA